MKEKYISLENDYLEILIPERFLDYGNKVLDYSTNKIKEYLSFFHEKSYGKKIKGAFLTTRNDFLERIKEVKAPEENMPPSWAKGCFYGDETQILIDPDDVYDMFHTLAHESFHLIFGKFVYDKNGWERFIWLDESLAGNFDDTTDYILKSGYFKEIVYKYYHMDDLPSMTGFDFTDGLFSNDRYNGYDFFKIIGRYLIEIYDTNDKLYEYVNDYQKILNDGDIILKNSLEYFYKKYKFEKK